MKEKSVIIKLIEFLVIIPLYYIAGKNSLFLYATTLSLYNIYLSCFSHITLKETFEKIKYDYSKFKLLKFTTLSITIICALFVLLSILISDTINIFLDIENTFLPCLIMSISIITEPLIRIFLDYLESYNKPKLSNSLLNVYYILEIIFLLLISIFTISVFKLPIYISISLLYLSKILSFIIVTAITYITLAKKNINFANNEEEKEINYKTEIKEILKNNSHKSIINLVKNSYYYISIIILYTVLSTRYSYNITVIEEEITFVYFYALTIVNFIIDIILSIIKYLNKKMSIINYICKVFEAMLTIAIVLGITSPLICKVIFNNSTNSIYLIMMISLSIFIALFKVTFEEIKNKKIVYISLIIGVISKIILIVPLINAFYRMGYNLIYGDIISTIISMFISIIINYIYIKTHNKKEKTLEIILTTLYESILLCIILVLIQFIIPIKTDSYLKALFLLIIYTVISVIFIKFKKKKRGQYGKSLHLWTS